MSKTKAKATTDSDAARPVDTPPAAAKKVAARKAPAKAPVVPTPEPQASPQAEPVKGKHKLVRDSFTMPSQDFDLIQALKERALNFKRPAKKSELLRAGLHALAALSDAKLKSSLDSLAPLKAGRPKKNA